MHCRLQLFRAYCAAEGEVHPEDGATASVLAPPICGEVGLLLIKSQMEDYSGLLLQACRNHENTDRVTRGTTNGFFQGLSPSNQVSLLCLKFSSTH